MQMRLFGRQFSVVYFFILKPSINSEQTTKSLVSF